MQFKKWRVIFLWVFFLLITLVGVVGCSKGGEGNSNSNAKAFFWEVRSPGGEVQGYLLGSIHVLTEDFFPLRNEIEAAYSASDVLLVEVNLSGGDLARATQRIYRVALYSGKETLKDNVSRETYELLDQRLKGLKLGSVEGYKRMKPWMVAMLILQSELSKMGLNPDFGVDKYFMDRVEKDKSKRIEELEGLDFQLEIFLGMTQEEGEQFLLSSLKEVDVMKKELRHLLESWKNGDTVSMERILNESNKDYPGLEAFGKKFIDDRNVRMVGKIKEFFLRDKTRKYFIVVGAAHMIGKMGIVQLLIDSGFQVKQL